MVFCLDQITASIAKYILSLTGEHIKPYYNDLAEGFHIPSVFFPEQEIGTSTESLNVYALNNTWYIKFFHSTTNEAFSIAKMVQIKIVGGRYLVPIVDEEGKSTKNKIRIRRVVIKKIDDGVCQMWLEWDESYEYDDVSTDIEKIQSYDMSLCIKD